MNLKKKDQDTSIAKTKKHLYEKLQPHKRSFSKSYPGLPQTWLADEEIAIEWIVGLNTERCRELIRLTEYTICLLDNSVDFFSKAVFSDIKNNKLKVWYTDNLVDIFLNLPLNKGKKHRIETAHKFSFTMTIFGLFEVQLLSAERYSLHLEDKGTLDHVLLWTSRWYNDEPRATPMLEKTRQRLSSKAAKRYNRAMQNKGQFHRILKDNDDRILSSFIWEYLNQVAPTLYKLVELAEQGDKKLMQTAIAVKNDFIDENKKFKETYTEDLDINTPGREKPNPEKTNSQLSALDKLSGIRELLRNPDPLDHKILTLHFLHGLNPREIAEKVEISKSEINRRINCFKSEL